MQYLYFGLIFSYSRSSCSSAEKPPARRISVRIAVANLWNGSSGFWYRSTISRVNFARYRGGRNSFWKSWRKFSQVTQASLVLRYHNRVSPRSSSGNPCSNWSSEWPYPFFRSLTLSRKPQGSRPSNWQPHFRIWFNTVTVSVKTGFPLSRPFLT